MRWPSPNIKKSLYERVDCSVYSDNYTHTHIKSEMGQTKESVP